MGEAGGEGAIELEREEEREEEREASIFSCVITTPSLLSLLCPFSNPSKKEQREGGREEEGGEEEEGG